MEDAGKSNWKVNLLWEAIWLSIVMLPPILAYALDDSGWLFAWVILLILGLAG